MAEVKYRVWLRNGTRVQCEVKGSIAETLMASMVRVKKEVGEWSE